MAAPRILVEDATGELVNSEGPVTFGTRTGNNIVLKDPIAAARHCEFSHDGTFRVRDLGSVTGTWLDGAPVRGTVDVRDGSQVVFGASRVLAKIEDREGTSVLVLQLQRNGFWWTKAGKKVFDNDPDALVRSEVAFGQFPMLRFGNRLAMLVAAVLLVGGTFLASIIEPLADAGPLVPSHALITGSTPIDATHAALSKCRALADAQGCNVCHTTGAGTPDTKCLQCHTDFIAENASRHPYVGDGKLGQLTGMVVDQSFCVLCHRDHEGSDWLKPISDTLVGQCESCHGAGQQRQDLERRVPPVPPPTRDRSFTSIRFPHDVHVQKQIDCVICHVGDATVKANKEKGFPDDPAQQDFAEAPYETCKSCHVAGAAASGMTAAQQELWRAKDSQWNVAWHGTEDGGSNCLKCHAQGQRSEQVVFGPEMRTVVRPNLTPAQHAAERARYTTTSRSHREQFEKHADGKECVTCHVSGSIATAEPAPRTFWHALHVTEGALAPAAGKGGEISTNLTEGCWSCHQDMRAAQSLTDASKAAYHWPTTEEAQAKCKDCHLEGNRALPLVASSTTIGSDRRFAPGVRADFPHDVHVRSGSFGKTGTLAEGCFACHGFERPPGSSEFQFMPTTRPEAADCTQCHNGHANIGGGDCEVCHPLDRTTTNSFLVAAGVPTGTVLRGQPTPAAAARAWPGLNGFSHLSRGHVGPDITCATCHDAKLLGAAKSVASVPVPDDATPACRECHLKKQFHWR